MPLIRRLAVSVALASALVFSASAVAAPAHPRLFLSEAKLGSLRARASANDPDWKALKSRCDRYQSKVEFPNGAEYPNNAIGSGYEGSSYFAAVANLGLCYQVALGIDANAAAHYGQIGASVLEHMLVTEKPRGQDPKTNDGYGVRFYAAGMALGYDWLFPVLSDELKTQLTASIKTWISTFSKSGFERDFPQGNYFAGYYAASAYAGMALAGDSATGDQLLSDWQNGLQNGMVQPYSAANLSGGGWPEGWNYGPLGVTNMSLPAVAAQTALGADLVHDPARPFNFPVANPRYLLYFTWPDMTTLDDADKTYDGSNPTATDGTLFSTEAGVLHAFGDSFAPYFTNFASKIRELHPGKEEADLWENFLFWDPSAPQASYTKLPLSYLAQGMEAAAVRSDWGHNAVWGTFKSGPYTNSPEAGWQYFDEGSLAIVNGSVPFLVNAPGALLRNTPGTPEGSEFATKLDDDLFFGNPPNRDLFNVFYVNKPTPEGQTDRLRSEGAQTRMQAFHDGGSYVSMVGTHLEDMYRSTVKGWSRSVVYLRPGVFVVFDRTQISDPSIDQWMAFHFSGEPALDKKGGRGGARRYDVKTPLGYAGSVDTVLPKGHQEKTTPVLGSRKVVRLEIRPGHAGPSQQWLTVFDAAESAKTAAVSSPLKAKGESAGVLLRRGHTYQAVLFGANNAKHVRYRLPAGRTTNVLTGLVPGAAYKVHFSRGLVDVRLGKGKKADETGALSFKTGAVAKGKRKAHGKAHKGAHKPAKHG